MAPPAGAGPEPPAMTLERNLAARRKRLRFRCWHRGSREADLLLGRFADSHLDAFDAAQIDRFERLLACDDPDIWDWAVRGAAAPAGLDTDVLALLRASGAAASAERP